MKRADERGAKMRAKTLGFLAFSFMLAVSILIFLSEDDLAFVSYALMVCAPFVFGVLAYFIGLHHDPSAGE